SQTPRPVINLIGKTGTGPHTVHVHALASTLNGGDYLTARWQWDFGDPGGKYNQLEGWNAAHVYDNPGTYTIRLTLTNQNGKSNQVMIQDLAFDTPFLPKGNEADKIGITAIYPRGVNITIRGCEFLNLDDAVNANSDPRGLLVQDNTAPLPTGLRNYFIWSE